MERKSCCFPVLDLESRTEEIQAKLRSEKIMTRVEGCRAGSIIPAVMEVSTKDSNSSERIERVARFWAEVHKSWLGPLVADKWDGELD